MKQQRFLYMENSLKKEIHSNPFPDLVFLTIGKQKHTALYTCLPFECRYVHTNYDILDVQEYKVSVFPNIAH